MASSTQGRGEKSRQYVKEPSLLVGDASTFKEWVFSLELALKAESLAEPEMGLLYVDCSCVGSSGRLDILGNAGNTMLLQFTLSRSNEISF